jgi:hypothetical protein
MSNSFCNTPPTRPWVILEAVGGRNGIDSRSAPETALWTSAISSSSLPLAFQTQPNSLLGPSLSRSPTLLATFLGPSTSNHVSSLPTDAASLPLIAGTNSSPSAKPAASSHLLFPQLLNPVGFHAPPANEPDSPIDPFPPASSPRSFPFAPPARFSFFFPRDSGCDPGYTHFFLFFSCLCQHF